MAFNTSRYPKMRLNHALKVFGDLTMAQPPIAEGPGPIVQQLVQGQTKRKAFEDSDEDGSYEYNVDDPTKHQLVTSATKPSTAKRAKTNAIDGAGHGDNNGAAPKSNHGSIGIGPGSEARKNDLRPKQTYLEKKDDESSKITSGGTRSGLIRRSKEVGKVEDCIECVAAKKECSARQDGSVPCRRCVAEGLNCAKHSTETAKNFEDKEVLKTKTADSKKMPPRPLPKASTTPAKPHVSLTQHECAQRIRAHYIRLNGLPFGTAGMSKINPMTVDSPPSSPRPAARPASRPTNKSATLSVIKTAWAHPMDLLRQLPEDKPCHFCHDFRFGICGHGSIEVEVIIDPAEDFKFQETGNGHRAQGYEETRMCKKCAFTRLYISWCPGHFLRRREHPKPDLLLKYNEQVNNKEYPNCLPLKETEAAYRPCRLCAQPAFWQCCGDQVKDIFQRPYPEGGGKGKGCGLILCETCAAKVNADKGLRKTTVGNRDRQREDMEFLFEGSIIHKAYKFKAEEAANEAKKAKEAEK